MTGSGLKNRTMPKMNYRLGWREKKKKRRKQCIIEKLFTLPSDMTDKIDKVSENQNDTPWTVHQEKYKFVL